MPHLRPTAIAGLLLAAATLSSCGFDYQTDRVNTVAAGVNDRDGDVDALGIRVLATAEGEGRLIGALANNVRESAALEAVTSTENITAGEFAPVEVAGRGVVNLAEAALIPLTGDFTAGDFVPLELSFSNDETVTLDVPVVKPCFQYTQIPTEAAASEPSAKGSAKASASASASASAGESASETAGESAGETAAASETGAEEAEGEESIHVDEHGEGGDATFSCADEAPAPEGEH